jgi:peptidoglycan/xylan/chitin deacetylase (PgdA/CDA1 family)/sulfur carrier protein ThiS
MAPPMAGRSLRSAWCGAALLVCAAILAACQPMASPHPAPVVQITVGEAPHQVAPGTTLGDVVRRFGLEAQDGRLLSVSGAVLDPAIAPGLIELNGRIAPSDTRLGSGDSILVKDGVDRTEGTRRIVGWLPGRHLGDPELTLRRFRIRRITVEGSISGDAVSTREVSVGRGISHGEVALTFDDGPWPRQTKHVVDILQRLHVRATFFMVGYLVDRYPGIVKMVAKAGMRIGDHSWDHPVDPAFADLTREHVADEIGRTADALASVGVVSRLFRPPGGSFDAAVVREAGRQHMRVVTWSVDPRDWSSHSTSRQIVHRVLRAVEPGSIVLMHDGGGDQSATIHALPKVIRGIRRMGLHLVAIPKQA